MATKCGAGPGPDCRLARRGACPVLDAQRSREPARGYGGVLCPCPPATRGWVAREWDSTDVGIGGGDHLVRVLAILVRAGSWG